MLRFWAVSAFLLLTPSLALAQTVGTACTQSQLGTTTMASDQTNIVACLKEGTGYVWKSMTSNATPNCRVCLQIVDTGGGRTSYSPWQCTPYGGGQGNFAFDDDGRDPDGARVSFDCK